MNTYDPFTMVERPKVGVFSGLPSAAPGTVLVVDRVGHELRALTGPSDRLTAGEVRWGQIRTIYGVDVSEHQLEFDCILPCRDDIGGFRAEVQLTCMVINPADVVRRGIHDVSRTVGPMLIETLRRVCGDFAAEECDAAEQASIAAVRERESEDGHDRAFRITDFRLVLALDDAAAAYIRERKEAKRDHVRQRDRAELEAAKTRLAAQLERTQDELRAERDKAAARFEEDRIALQQQRERLEGQLEDQRQQLELARAAARAHSEQQMSSDLERERLLFERERQKMQAKLDRARIGFDMDRAKLESEHEKLRLQARLDRQRIEINQHIEMLSRGEYAALAMRLVDDPSTITQISEELAQQRRFDANLRMQALQIFLDKVDVEEWEFSDEYKSALKQLIDVWSSQTREISARSSSSTNTVEGELASLGEGQRHGEMQNNAETVTLEPDLAGPGTQD